MPKTPESDFSFILGQNSSIDPVQLPGGFYARGMNVVNRGGIVQCRPGYRCLTALPDGLLQGFHVFKPKIGIPIVVVAVAGRLYVCDFPYGSWRLIDGISMSSIVSQIYFQQVEQAVVSNEDGSISFLSNPKNLLIIQDGGFSAGVSFDGTTFEAQRGVGKLPVGGPMAWVGDRLWVARDSRVYASDLGNPLAFVESLYVSGAGSLVFPDTVTALATNPAVQTGQLFVYTNKTTSMVQAGVRARALWSQTVDFQKQIFDVGCVSQRSVIAQHGYLWWFSEYGLTSLDSAAQTNVTSSLPYQDDAMTDSKARLSEDLSGVACAAFENYLLVSVPHSSNYNTHTWVLDQAPLKVGGNESPAWNSFWTGTRPVQWATENVNGRNRCLYVSADVDGVNRLWEAFTPDRLDEGCPITWWMETRALNGRLPGFLKDFHFAEVFSTELEGQVDFAVFYAGAYRGRYKQIMTKRIQASVGPFVGEVEFNYEDILFSSKKQSRPLRTVDAKASHLDEPLSSCDVEDPHEEFRDEAFQLLIVGSGPGAIRGYTTYTSPVINENESGRCEKDETEGNYVRADGGAAEAETIPEAIVDFGVNNPVFNSTRVETVTQEGITEVASGSAESVISQANADYIATCIARRLASHNLEEQLPLIVSQGELANE
jgi:hypothetical protein